MSGYPPPWTQTQKTMFSSPPDDAYHNDVAAEESDYYASPQAVDDFLDAVIRCAEYDHPPPNSLAHLAGTARHLKEKRKPGIVAELVEALEAMKRRMHTILSEVEGTEYAYVHDGVTGAVMGQADATLAKARPERVEADHG